MTEPQSSSPQTGGAGAWLLRSLVVFALTNFVQLAAAWAAALALILLLQPTADAPIRAFISVFFGLSIMTTGAWYPLISALIALLHRARVAPLAHAAWTAAAGAYAFSTLPPNIRVSDPPVFIVIGLAAIAGYFTFRAAATLSLQPPPR